MPARRRLGWVLLAAGLLAWPAAWVADALWGETVTVLARVRSDAERAAWKRRGWDARDGVAELYGVVEPPAGLRVLLLGDARLIRPPEDPSLRLLPVDRRAGEDLLLARALRFRAALAGLGLGLLGALLIGRRPTPSRSRA